MPQVRLQNRTGRKVTDGELVRLYPGTTDSFIVAKLSEFGIIGSVSGTILTGQVGNINLINTVDYSKLTGIPGEFPPEAHTHLYSDIEDHPSFYTQEEFQTPGWYLFEAVSNSQWVQIKVLRHRDDVMTCIVPFPCLFIRDVHRHLYLSSEVNPYQLSSL